jgi:hypothetical protein
MDTDVEINWPEFNRVFLQLNLITGKPLQEEMAGQARLLIQDTIKVTPPFHQGKGQSAREAKKAGDASVRANINRLFIGRTLRGERRITHLFGRTDVPGLPFIVKTKEKYPAVEDIYRHHKHNARLRNARGLGFPRLELPVSRTKVEALKRKQLTKVGWLASGWNASAHRFGSTVPAFVKRHGTSAGRVRVDFTQNYLRMTAINSIPYARNVGSLEQRLAFALVKRVHAMEAQIVRFIKLEARARRVDE